MNLSQFSRLIGFSNPSEAVAKSLIPNEPRDDDIFLVSYPKSGNTWISFLIANAMVDKLGLDLEVNHFNIHGFVPDIHQGQDIPQEPGFFPFKRIIKSHSPFNPDYKHIINLVRDPRSVMVSYHHFLLGQGSFAGSISELIRNPVFGISAWVAHVNGWLNNTVPGTRFQVFRYEDFKADTLREASRLLRLLGLRPDETELSSIVRKSDFRNMQELEKATGSLSIKKIDEEFRFVREGKSEGWKSLLSKGDEDYIIKVAGESMNRFGYEH